MDAPGLVDRLLSEGIRVYPASPWVITVPPASTTTMDELMEHAADLFSTFESFHPCQLCFESTEDTEKKDFKWRESVYRAVDSPESHPDIEALELMLRVTPFRHLFSCALALVGPLSDAELSTLDLHRAWAEAVIKEIYDQDIPVLFGSNLPGVYHPDCIVNHGWSLPSRTTLMRVPSGD